jgi:sialic acid synthase SpsE
MLTYKKIFNCLYGYSDHTLDFINPVAATTLGASVYEKHFTLDKKMAGPDHRMSLSPKELKKTIKLIRDTEVALGSFEKKILNSEKENRKKLKKSLVSKVFIQKGRRLSQAMFEIKRPGTGLMPYKIYTINNYKASTNIKSDSVLKSKMIKKI